MKRTSIAFGRDSQGGISLIETLIAMLLLSFIAIGLLPLMTRSVQQNSQAGAYSTSTNWARSSIEDLSQIAFESPRITIPGGSTSLTITEVWQPSTSTWVTPPLAPAIPAAPTDLENNPWQRTIVVEQFGMGDLEDNGVLDSPLDGSTIALFVQIKRLRVTIQRQSNRILDGTPPITIDYIKTL